jgi:hypothetical protein
MDGSQVVVEQIDVAAGDLQRARAVAKDALEAEHVAARKRCEALVMRSV